MEDTHRVLHDIHVLDLSQGVPGPFCAKLLAGLGAEVIKVEPPGTGDLSRSAGPFLGAGEDGQTQNSALFLYLNTSKKGITWTWSNRPARRFSDVWCKNATY